MAGEQKNPILLYALIILTGLGYYYFGYHLDRSSFYELIGLYTFLFSSFIWMIYKFPDRTKLLWSTALLFRVIFLFALPNLSQDFYRFIWDGNMIWEGLNPYLYTPSSFLETGEMPFRGGKALIDGMGSLSAGNFTNYPPLNQLCFAIATILPGAELIGAVIIMRLMMITADIGTFYFGSKLLSNLGISRSRIFWFILNPFIIIELTGNLHFEGIMIFFLVLALYLLQKGKWILSAAVLACSISIKLIPLMFLPLLIQQLRFRSIRYYGLVGVLTLISFLPFYSSEFVTNFSGTIGLWFQKFEFNASLYYVARAIGYTFRGYNEIAIIGSYIPYIVVVFILTVSLLRNNRSSIALITAMLLCLTFYFFTSTTVHPWYIATLVALSIFTRYRFALVWSFVVMLSYWAYGQADFKEDLWLIGLEYGIVFGLFIMEIFGINLLRRIKASSVDSPH